MYIQWMLQKPMLMDWYCGATLRLLDFPSMSFATGFFKVTWSLQLEGKPEIITSRKTKLCLHWANFLHYAQFMHVSSEYVALRWDKFNQIINTYETVYILIIDKEKIVYLQSSV